MSLVIIIGSISKAMGLCLQGLLGWAALRNSECKCGNLGEEHRFRISMDRNLPPLTTPSRVSANYSFSYITEAVLGYHLAMSGNLNAIQMEDGSTNQGVDVFGFVFCVFYLGGG